MLKVFVIGHLGKDAVVNNVGGKNVINFSLCSTEKWTDAAGLKKEKSTWVDCSMWRDSVNVAQYLRKGVQAFVEGTVEAKTYQRSDGTAAASLSVRVSNLQLLGGGSGQQSNAPVAAASETTLPNLNSNDDEQLPF